MEILFTGSLQPLSSNFFVKIADKFKIIICEGNAGKEWEAKNVTPYGYVPGDEEFEKMFKTYNFGAVCYISKALEGDKKIFNELESLENTLYQCKKNKIKNFIYIATNEFEGVVVSEHNPSNSRLVLLQSCENLCEIFAKNNDMNITIIRVPYLYNMVHFETMLGKLIKSGIEKNEVLIPASTDTEIDFLAETDLSVLILRLLDEQLKGYVALNVSGDAKCTFGDIAQRLQNENPELTITFNNSKGGTQQYIKESVARKDFGWFPVANFDSAFLELYKKCELEHSKKTKPHFYQWKNEKVQNIIVTILELAVLFGVVELLNYLVEGNQLLDFLDFRLLFVVIMGTMRGLNIGIIAAFLACISYILGASDDVNWQIIFYNIENWFPFAVYLLVGSISGYSRDKNQDKLKFMEKEQEVLEKKYIFLSELYAKTLENKDEYSSQIISYTDSFGRIYDIVKRLHTTLPEKVFYEAIRIMEDALENTYVAIYTVDEKSDYARLSVCSKELSATLPKSAKISEYPELMDTIYKKETWINTTYIPDYPIYATPIYKEDQIVGLIMLMKVTNKQMNTEYANKFNIVTGLIKDSLVQAIERMELTEKNRMIPDTRILNEENFKTVLQVEEQMKENDFSDYLLVQLLYENITLPELSEIIMRAVRHQDILGQGTDGKIYLLLSQANSSYVALLEERLAKEQIRFNVMK